MHIGVPPKQTRKTRKPADSDFESACEEVMKTWPNVWVHRWAVEYGQLRYEEGREHEAAFARAFKSIRDQIASGAKPPICCETARVLARSER